MKLLEEIEQEYCKSEVPDINRGDTVRVHIRFREGEKERIQIYEGLVIAVRGKGVNMSITVRKISFGEGVERVFPVHSPMIAKIEVTGSSRVRRSKLYFTRGLSGKKMKLRQNA